MGSGTTALMALKSNRHYIGYDISEDYIKSAERRLLSIKTQTKLVF
jgi:DNA modification methylase